ATNTMTIKPGGGATPTISGSSPSAIIELQGADYVTIDGSNTNGGTTRDLTIQNTNTASNTAAVWLASQGTNAGATFDTMKNSNNTIGSNNSGAYNTFRGIELVGALAPVVTQNEIFNQITTTVNQNIAGIELGSTVYNGDISRNKVHDIINNNPAKFGNFGI